MAKKNSAAKTPKTTGVPFDGDSQQAFEKRLAEAMKHFAAFRATLGDLPALTAEDRAHAQKFRDGEAVALTSALDVADMEPALFKNLADEDDGLDPDQFETSLLRLRVTHLEALNDFLSKTVLPTVTGLSDAALRIANSSKPVMLAAYKIAKNQATHSDAIQSKLAPALDFYGAIGKAGSETKAEKKQKSQKPST